MSDPDVAAIEFHAVGTGWQTHFNTYSNSGRELLRITDEGWKIPDDLTDDEKDVLIAQMATELWRRCMESQP